MKIAVYGATGFTAKLVAGELVRRGLEPVLIARDGRRLAETAAELGLTSVEQRVAGLDEPDALVTALNDCQVVVNCVAPFAQHGLPVARAAIAAGCHYVDTSGEQLHIADVYESLSRAAEEAGVTLVPAATDDGVPADLVARLTADLVGPVNELTVSHRLVDAMPSGGTLRSVVANPDTFTPGGGLSYQDGVALDGRPARATSVVFPGESSPTTVIKFGVPELPSFARHIGGHIEGVADAAMVEAFAGAASLEVPVGAGPGDTLRSAARFTVVIDALGIDGRCSRGVFTGTDMYGTTAVVAVEAARRLVADGAKPGALAPSQAFDPVSFLDYLKPHGLTWTVA